MVPGAHLFLRPCFRTLRTLGSSSKPNFPTEGFLESPEWCLSWGEVGRIILALAQNLVLSAIRFFDPWEFGASNLERTRQRYRGITSHRRILARSGVDLPGFEQ